MIKVVAIGDVVGRAGRQAVERCLPIVREKFDPEFVILNGENSAGGFGLTEKIYKRYIDELGIDAITSGNHWADKRDIIPRLRELDRLILPVNMLNAQGLNPGVRVIRSKRNPVQIAVANMTGKAFMHPDNSCPYETIDKLSLMIPDTVKVRILDLHAEATSEKQGMGRYLVGRFSLVYGTHSHVPTADDRILGGYTGFLTDIGMTGAYESVIGMDISRSIERQRTGKKVMMEPAENDPWMCFLIATIDEKTGRCEKVERNVWRLSEM